jgi:mxaJ protein
MNSKHSIRLNILTCAAILLLSWVALPTWAQCCGQELEYPSPPVSTAAGGSPGTRILKIAADPNNLPFTNDKLEGFENKIAALVADELNAQIQYIWRPQRLGFFQATLQTGQADAVVGAPAGMAKLLTTAPYYRSSYCFVSRKDRRLRITSFDDPSLKDLTIGVQLIGRGGNTPPVKELASRGIIDNIRGFMVRGDGSQSTPSAPILQAVDNGEIDEAVVWGPLAGPLIKKEFPDLSITPVDGASQSAQPMNFDICFAVGSSNQNLCAEINRALQHKKAEIQRILTDFGVPLMNAGDDRQ